MSTHDPLLSLKGAERWLFFFKKFLEYLVRYSKDPRYLYLYITSSLNSNYKEAVHFMSDEMFLKTAHERSTIRLGDGEFGMLMSGRDIHFQRADRRLLEILSDMLSSYDSGSPYVLGLNPQIIMPNKLLQRYHLKFLFLPQKIGYKLRCRPDAMYFNASHFYLKDKVRPFIELVSKNKQVILIAKASELQIAKELERVLFPQATRVTYIEVPEREAFERFDQIRGKVKGLGGSSDSVILVSAGPAGKALIYALSQEGYLGHDLGHGLNFALNNTDGEDLVKWPQLRQYWERQPKYNFPPLTQTSKHSKNKGRSLRP